MSEFISRWGAPVTYVGAVLVISLTLIGILVRSPDTRSNFQDAADAYDRTELAVIGEEDRFEGLTPALGPTPQEIYFGAGCASCHGLSGEGGVVGPDIWKTNTEDMLDALRGGEHGMPLFSSERLSDEQVETLIEYLGELREAARRDSERGLTVASTETPEPAATVAPTETPEPAATVAPTETPASSPPPGPGSTGVVRARVEINHKGFDGSPQFLLEVELGQRVELTFVWTDADPENAHRMHLDGYGLQTKLLDGDRREDTMSFVADRPGSFELTCDWRCEGHKNLKGGVVQVSEGGPS